MAGREFDDCVTPGYPEHMLTIDKDSHATTAD
jgi:hypothetical protein